MRCITAGRVAPRCGTGVRKAAGGVPRARVEVIAVTGGGAKERVFCRL